MCCHLNIERTNKYAVVYEKLVSGDEKLALVGLGYVGMPIAVAFSKKVKVVGYDLNAKENRALQERHRPDQ